jgi:hypothetical protein
LYTFAEDVSDNPTFYADLQNPQSLNKYQYAYNNPLRYVDPDGHDPLDPEPDPQNPTCPCTMTPAQQEQMKKDIEKALDWVAGVTGITALADAIRENGPAAAKAFWEYAKTHPGQSAMQQDMEDLRSLRQPQAQNAQNQSQTAEKQKNVADAEKKGIPKDQLGPSGKPKVHVVKHPTEKRAKDAARNQGQGAPAKDASPRKGGPHYHPTNRDGSRKKGKQNIHHEYPD